MLVMLLLASAAACGDRGERLMGGGGDDIEPGGTAILAERSDMNHPSPITRRHSCS